MSHVEGDTIKYFGTSDHVVMRLLIVCDNNLLLRKEITAIQNEISILPKSRSYRVILCPKIEKCPAIACPPFPAPIIEIFILKYL